MTFFTTSDASGAQWVMSPYIWLYFVVSLILTGLTLGYWRWRLRLVTKSRSTKEEHQSIV
jgi:hypothetical protein